MCLIRVLNSACSPVTARSNSTDTSSSSVCDGSSTKPSSRNRYSPFFVNIVAKKTVIANSDFHKPKHIYSWKTLIYAGKDSEAIKDCIRRNEHVAITLYRDFAGASPGHTRHGFDTPAPAVHYFQDRFPLHVVNS
ncbi:MAG: hypothetical protein ACLQHM_14170 [Limisphaerales bacterium]